MTFGIVELSGWDGIEVHRADCADLKKRAHRHIEADSPEAALEICRDELRPDFGDDADVLEMRVLPCARKAVA